MAFLTTVSGPAEGDKHEIGEGDTVIGRHPECKIVVEVGAVSRYHAKIVRQGNSIQVEDLKSRNGTFVNGQLINGNHALQEGDKIRICEVEFSFHRNAPTAPFGGPTDESSGGFGVMLIDDESDSSSSSQHVEVIKDDTGTVRVDAGTEVKLNALLEISKSLGGHIKLDSVLPKTLESLFRIFPQADRGFIVMESPNGDLIPRWHETRRGDDGSTVRISRTIIRQVMDAKHPILSLDAANDERFEMSESIADFRIRSMICAPLLDSEGNAFGTLQIDTMDQKNRFNDVDKDLLASVASQAGVAIHSAQLYEEAIKQQALKKDVELAETVQQAFLPMSAPDYSDYEFYNFYRAAHHIGGDYYDYINLGEGRVGIIVADVVGHGVAAAMFMAKLAADTNVCLASESNPATAIEKLNERMSALPVEQFVTFLMVILDSNEHTMTIVNAGHMPPMVLSKSGELSEPGEEESGIPIAVMEGMDYEAVTVPLNVGDKVVMYTDGINEAMNNEDEEFGMDGVRQAVKASGTSQEIGERILKDIEKFAEGAAQFDDMCLVIFGRNS